MKIPAQKIYIPLFITVLLLQLYLPSFKANIFIQIFALGICAFLNDVSLTVKFVAYIKPFIILLAISAIGTVFYKYELYNILKDLFHFLKPITGLLLGYIIFKRINNFKKFIQTIVIAGIISSLIHFYVILVMTKLTGSIEAIRMFTKDNFLDLFALFFLVYYKKFEGTSLFNKSVYNKIAIVLISLSCILYFSRTMVVMGILLVISAYGYTKISAKNAKPILIILACVGLLYSYLYSTNIKRGADGFEGFLYKVKMAPAEIFESKIDRDNHANLWDHWRAYEAKRALALMAEQPTSYIFGTGLGSIVNLKFYAPLTGEIKGIRYISDLHNGYIYILYKTGIIGICIYLFIIFRWYFYTYKKQSFINTMISAIGLIYIFSTLSITGLYNGRDIIIFILGGFLHFANSNKTKSTFNNEHILQKSGY